MKKFKNLHFADEKELAEYCEAVENASQYIKVARCSIEFKAVHHLDTSLLTMEQLKNCNDAGDGIVLQTKTLFLVAHPDAIQSLGKCLGLYGDALKQMSGADLRITFNKVRKYKKGTFYVRVCDGMIASAFEEFPDKWTKQWAEIPDKEQIDYLQTNADFSKINIVYADGRRKTIF